MSFKLIAIRPLMEYNSKFLKNLKKNQLYVFYNNYIFEHKDGNSDKEIISVKSKKEILPNLYNVSYLNDEGLSKKNISVNISAIVGKNGSGKSSIADLFLISMFFLCHRLKFVERSDFIDSDNDEENDRYTKDLREIEKIINVEIFYSLNFELYILKISKGNIYLEKAIVKDNTYNFQQNYQSIQQQSDLPPFFYSMIVNYSIYSFNTNHFGIWLKGVFHKNDGYQMPIVINPYKNQGNTDINTETYLTRGRVLSNLIVIEEYRNKINPKSAVENVEIYFDKNKDYSNKFSEQERLDYRKKIIEPLFLKMFKGEAEYPKIDTPIEILAESYLIQKIKNIPRKYKIFESFIDVEDGILEDKFIDAIFQNRTHITLKIFQTLNFIHDHSYYEIPSNNISTKLDFGKITRVINNKKKHEWFTEPVEYLPPPFFVTRIVFHDNSLFDDLSSGERQKIYSLNSIIYHLSNLDSVSKHHRSGLVRKPIIYENVNLILDEIELYYHPEYQRNFISDLLDFIKNASFKSIKRINILFLTHSPFILSDIPKSNILFLEVKETIIDIEGEEKKLLISTPQKNIKKTFAANIHELFRSGFFMKNTQGAFALSKITEIIEFCGTVEKALDEKEIEVLRKSYSIIKEEYQSIIHIIGEEFIANALKNNLIQVEKKLYTEKEYLKNRQVELQAEIEEINQKLDDQN